MVRILHLLTSGDCVWLWLQMTRSQRTSNRIPKSEVRPRRDTSSMRRRKRPGLFPRGDVVTAGMLFSTLCLGSSASYSSLDTGGLSFEIHPSAQLLIDEERRRNLKELPAPWFDSRSNAVYATLPKAGDKSVPSHHRRTLEDFHSNRHLSRYELQHRLEYDIDLPSDWNGSYFPVAQVATGDANISTRQNFRRKLEPVDPYQAAPLSQGYGTHYAHVWVGSPIPQRKSVIVDTGSHYTAFPCMGCRECGEEHHTDPYYDFERSSTFRALPCKECKLGATCSHDQCIFSQSYTEGSSWDAFQAQDMFYCGGNNVLASADSNNQHFAIPFLFGCQTAETGLFVTQLADGIMGMSAHDFTLPKQMYDAGKLDHNMFSMCFRRELATSKRGVTAGFMNLGGVDSRLDSSPMVYARNIASSGWFTVYVKNIFIRSNGGQHATNIPEENQHILKIPLDLSVVNSGKGVIVDSGTTDTYLHKNLATSFIAVWKQVTGKEYSHNGIALTESQLMQLPTILIQCQAAMKHGPTLGSLDGVIGLAGRLDPTSPHDVLVAIPATNYMEYSPNTNLYTSRLYFTETRGGVLGANAMQGHNVVFDWQNGRVGFAESDCEYREQDAFPDTVKDLNKNRIQHDCILGPPSLQHACVDSVDLSLCRQDPSQSLKGFEHWTRVVKNAGTETGMTCIEAGMLGTSYSGSEPPRIECNGEGLCKELRPCEFHCAFASGSSSPETPTTLSGTQENCEDDWSSCSRSCTQSRVVSELQSDGLCHEKFQTSRPCHTGACGGQDRCLIPFFVHSVLGLRGADLSKWTRKAEELMAAALVKVIEQLGGDHFGQLFAEGDIDVMMVSPWEEGPRPENPVDDVASTQVVLQISVFNPQASLPEESIETARPSSGSSGGHNRLLQLFDSLGQRLRVYRRRTSCAEGDLYPQALQAMKLHDLLERHDFMVSLVAELQRAESGEPPIQTSPFRQMYGNGFLISQSKVISSWTIRTEELDAPEPTGEHPFMIHTKRLRQYANRSPLTTMMTTILLAFLLVSSCFGSYEIFVVKHWRASKEARDDDSIGYVKPDEEMAKLLPTRVLSQDDASVNSIDELFNQLANKGSPTRTSPRRRGSLDNWASNCPNGVERTSNGSTDRKRA